MSNRKSILSLTYIKQKSLAPTTVSQMTIWDKEQHCQLQHKMQNNIQSASTMQDWNVVCTHAVTKNLWWNGWQWR